MLWTRNKKALQQQQLENIKELKEIGIHYVSSEQYYRNKDIFNYAMGIIPTYKPTILEQLRISLLRHKK